MALSVLRKVFLPGLLLVGLLTPCFAASQPDPCNSLSFKQSAVINSASAATSAVVALSATHGIFVCGFTITIAGSATSAATAKFEYGPTTSTACDTTPTALTGVMGSGDAAVSTTPTQVTYGDGSSTIFTPIPPNDSFCIVTAGTTVDVQGVVTYVQGTGASYP